MEVPVNRCEDLDGLCQLFDDVVAFKQLSELCYRLPEAELLNLAKSFAADTFADKIESNMSKHGALGFSGGDTTWRCSFNCSTRCRLRLPA